MVLGLALLCLRFADSGSGAVSVIVFMLPPGVPSSADLDGPSRAGCSFGFCCEAVDAFHTWVNPHRISG